MKVLALFEMMEKPKDCGSCRFCDGRLAWHGDVEELYVCLLLNKEVPAGGVSWSCPMSFVPEEERGSKP